MFYDIEVKVSPLLDASKRKILMILDLNGLWKIRYNNDVSILLQVKILMRMNEERLQKTPFVWTPPCTREKQRSRITWEGIKESHLREDLWIDREEFFCN